MPKTLQEVIAALPAERQARVHARAEELIAEESRLRVSKRTTKQTQLRPRTGKPTRQRCT